MTDVDANHDSSGPWRQMLAFQGPAGSHPPSERVRPRIVSLFAGAGGLDHGFHRVGFDVAVAFDSNEAAIRSHRLNFPKTVSHVADIVALGSTGVTKLVLATIPRGSTIGVVGGPPCQGFSRANTASQHDDPRNQLAALYVEVVRNLRKHYKVAFIVLENVLGIRDRKHRTTFDSISTALETLGFDLAVREMCATDYGVPQKRRRVLIVGMDRSAGYSSFEPRKRRGKLTVRQAIGHLPEPVYFRRGMTSSCVPFHPNHWTMQPKSERFRRPAKVTRDGRSFKLLEWDSPSPTIAFGNREIHVHPSGHRRLSILEAMLLQGFPSKFILEGNLSEQVTQVSNAVPPPLSLAIARAVAKSLLCR